MNYPDETLPPCCYRCLFEEVPSDKRWNEIGDKRKQALIAQID